MDLGRIEMSVTIYKGNHNFRVKYWQFDNGDEIRLVLDRNSYKIWWELWTDDRFGIEECSREEIREYLKNNK